MGCYLFSHRRRLVSYTYNADGLRLTKTVNGVVTTYHWLEGTLLGQTCGNDTILFLYDENGSAYGFTHNGDRYYYVFNLQGDVIGILNEEGQEVVSYEYDVWGNVLSTTGTLANTVGQLNPIRYRGYYYDAETGFYYLQSRYYDPVTCRFINADGYVSTGQGVLGNNMFAYCGNNPVNLYDPSGQLQVAANIVRQIVCVLEEFVSVIMLAQDLKNMGFNSVTYVSAEECKDTMANHGIDTIEEKAHFFAQCAIESDLSLLEAGWLPYDRAENYRKDQPYYPYYGAGYIQITWDYNYKAFSEYMNDPLIYELGPEYVAANYAWSAAGWFWSKNNINAVIEKGGNVRSVTRIVNGGYNKLAEREAAYNRFLAILGG